VFEAAKRGGFDAEPVGESLARARDDFDGDGSVEVEVARTVDDAHASLTQPALELVLAIDARRARDRRFETRAVVRAQLDVVVGARVTNRTFLHEREYLERRISASSR